MVRIEDETSRRRMLGLLAGVGTAFALGCAGSVADEGAGEVGGASDGGGGSGGGANGSGGGATSATGGSATCTASPEGEIGPYFADDSDPRFNRSDVRSNLDGSNTQGGVPFALTIRIVDAENGCAPYANAQVDIWHCSADGIYSDEGVEDTTTEQWLRGFQLTGADGSVTFTTIIPGWYQGRTTHIHVRVRSTYSDASSTTDGANTTQVFFAQGVIDSIYTSVAPYSAKGLNTTTNASDHVYTGEEHGANELTLTGSAAAGFAASCVIGLPIGG
ncbi:MAG TPA: hypothetical protein VGM56_27980 [Byssovorax sp.]|jgi:protocatechuate 3,4-dioxygenase beta subunit